MRKGRGKTVRVWVTPDERGWIRQGLALLVIESSRERDVERAKAASELEYRLAVSWREKGVLDAICD